jgi:hypothetical protein
VLRHPTLVDEDPISTLYGKLLQVKRFGHVRVIADARKFERDVNPDAQVGNPIVDSNPVDVLVDRGRFVMADAGGNSVIRTDHKGRLEALAIFLEPPKPLPFGPPMYQAVPTGVVKGLDGFYYVSRLTGFPFPVGGAKVVRVNPRTGAYTVYASGFTMIMDLDFGNDGTLYVLEIDSDTILGRQQRGRAVDGLAARQAREGRAARRDAGRAGRDSRPTRARPKRPGGADRPRLRGPSRAGKG